MHTGSSCEITPVKQNHVEEVLLKVSTFLLYSPLVKAVSEKGRSIKDCDGNGMGDLFKTIVFVPVFLTMCYLVGTFVFHILKLQTNLIRSVLRQHLQCTWQIIAIIGIVVEIGKYDPSIHQKRIWSDRWYLVLFRYLHSSRWSLIHSTE